MLPNIYMSAVGQSSFTSFMCFTGSLSWLLFCRTKGHEVIKDSFLLDAFSGCTWLFQGPGSSCLCPRATDLGPPTPLSLAAQLPKADSPGLNCWPCSRPLGWVTLVVQQGADRHGAEGVQI